MRQNLHKTMFNRNLGLMIEVCETAHNNGKSSKDKVCKIALFTLSDSLSYSETKADLKMVNEQTGLFAGKDGSLATTGSPSPELRLNSVLCGYCQ